MIAFSCQTLEGDSLKKNEKSRMEPKKNLEWGPLVFPLPLRALTRRERLKSALYLRLKKRSF